MKKITFLCLLASIFLCPACNSPLQTFDLGIDVQTNFNNDLVQVYIDGDEVLNRRLKTLDVLGACLPDGKLLLRKSEGTHEIKVVVNNTIVHTESFNLNNNVYIGVNYSAADGFDLIYANQKFYYE